MQVLLLRCWNRKISSLSVQSADHEARSRSKEHIHRAELSRGLSLPPFCKGHVTANLQLRPWYSLSSKYSSWFKQLCSSPTNKTQASRLLIVYLFRWEYSSISDESAAVLALVCFGGTLHAQALLSVSQGAMWGCCRVFVLVCVIIVQTNTIPVFAGRENTKRESKIV